MSTGLVITGIILVLGFLLSIVANWIKPPERVSMAWIFGLALIIICVTVALQSCKESWDGVKDEPRQSSGPSDEAAVHPSDRPVLYQGVVDFPLGGSVNLETGEVGLEIDKPDVTLVDNTPEILVPGSRLLVELGELSSEPTLDDCLTELGGPNSELTGEVHGPGSWFCFQTDGGHIAAVSILELPRSHAPGKLQYIVWQHSRQ
ncbi:hypothetical protein Afil01_69210 [Actinorhabdospora filicis]|uniref:Uncharacterized protein n=1 Tax=Actinorhabdospora filicis TaxID=1785913 RepID=A0A9W6WCZ6_9ACTN|nr:hypothetical protein [Actinorhabdospora filicis]GLZ82114.1 hypothetical protein Afil01_69210 [Actinorhabdospora filicis]